MASFERNYQYKKKHIFNGGGNYLLSPLNNKRIDSLNIYKNNNSQNKNSIKIIINKINAEQYRKHNNNFNSPIIENILKNNKTYSLSRTKNDNKPYHKNKLSKIKLKDISTHNNTNNILSNITNSNNSELSSAKTNKYENISLTHELLRNKDNINKISNNAYCLKKLYMDRNMKDIISSNNDSFINEKNRQSTEYLKTDLNDIYTSPLSKQENIKLILPDTNIFGKKLTADVKNHNDIIGTPSGLFKKNSLSNFQFNTPGNMIKNFFDKKNKNIFSNINFIKLNKDEKQIILESITNQSTSDSKIKKLKKTSDINLTEIDSYVSKSKRGRKKFPEEIHFFFVHMMQEGKKNELELEGE